MLKWTYSPNYKDEDEDLDAVAREEREYDDEDNDFEYEYDNDINEREDAIYRGYQKELERYHNWLYKDSYY